MSLKEYLQEKKILAAEQLKAKQNYKELKKIITINILKYNYLERNSYHSIARMKYEDTSQLNLLIWATTRKRKKQQIHLKCTL